MYTFGHQMCDDMGSIQDNKNIQSLAQSLLPEIHGLCARDYVVVSFVFTLAELKPERSLERGCLFHPNCVMKTSRGTCMRNKT